VDRGDTNGIRGRNTTGASDHPIRQGQGRLPPRNDPLVPGNPAAALATLDTSWVRSRRPVAYNNRGTDPHALGGLKAAVADFDRGFELAPGYAEASEKTKSRGASHDRTEMK